MTKKRNLRDTAPSFPTMACSVTKGISYVRLGRHNSNLNVRTPRTAESRPCETQPLPRDVQLAQSEAAQQAARERREAEIGTRQCDEESFHEDEARTKSKTPNGSVKRCEKQKNYQPHKNTTRRRTSQNPPAKNLTKISRKKTRLGWQLGSQKWQRSLPSHHNI